MVIATNEAVSTYNAVQPSGTAIYNPGSLHPLGVSKLEKEDSGPYRTVAPAFSDTAPPDLPVLAYESATQPGALAPEHLGPTPPETPNANGMTGASAPARTRRPGISVYRLIALLKSEQIMGIGCTYTRDINPETWLEYMKGEIDRILVRYGETQDMTFHSKICLAHNDEKVDGNWQMRVGALPWDKFVMVFCDRYNEGYTLTGLLNRLMSMEPKDFATYRDYCYEFES
ncbi:hypothetical protein GGI06_004867, partial [Coemansia sp. S85]